MHDRDRARRQGRHRGREGLGVERVERLDAERALQRCRVKLGDELRLDPRDLREIAVDVEDGLACRHRQPAK